jgi:hypothetical protein
MSSSSPRRGLSRPNANVADECELWTIPLAIAIERKPPEFNLGTCPPDAVEPKPRAQPPDDAPRPMPPLMPSDPISNVGALFQLTFSMMATIK